MSQPPAQTSRHTHRPVHKPCALIPMVQTLNPRRRALVEATRGRVCTGTHGACSSTHPYRNTTALRIVAGGQQPHTGQRTDATRPRTGQQRSILTRESQLSRERETRYLQFFNSSYLRHHIVQESSTLEPRECGQRESPSPLNPQAIEKMLQHQYRSVPHPNKETPGHMTMRIGGVSGTHPNCSSRSSLSSVVAVSVAASIALRTDPAAWEFGDPGSVGGVKARGRACG